MSTVEKTEKSSKLPFAVTMSSLFIVLPLLYIAVLLIFLLNYFSLTYIGWKQVGLSNVGTIYIPEDWSYVPEGDGEIDALIYGPSTKVGDSHDESEKMLFVCYRYDNYKEAVQNGTVYDNLDSIINNSKEVAWGLYIGVGWGVLEYQDSETGKTSRYYRINIHRNGSYVIIATADSVELSTFVKIVLSFERY
jgi:hypothetical protein